MGKVILFKFVLVFGFLFILPFGLNAQISPDKPNIGEGKAKIDSVVYKRILKNCTRKGKVDYACVRNGMEEYLGELILEGLKVPDRPGICDLGHCNIREVMSVLNKYTLKNDFRVRLYDQSGGIITSIYPIKKLIDYENNNIIYTYAVDIPDRNAIPQNASALQISVNRSKLGRIKNARIKGLRTGIGESVLKDLEKLARRDIPNGL